MEKFYCALLFLIFLGGVSGQLEHSEHAYGLPTMERLEESSPNRPDATTSEDKINPIDTSVFKNNWKDNLHKFGTVVPADR